MRRLYRHVVVAHRHGLADLSAWITRATISDAELWFFRLPSYGFEYDPCYDAHRWSQRGFMVNLYTGKWRWWNTPLPELEQLANQEKR